MEAIQPTPTLEELLAAGDRRADEYEQRRFQQDVSYLDFVKRAWGHVANRFTYSDIPAPYTPSEIVLEMSHDVLHTIAQHGNVTVRPSMSIDIIRMNETGVHIPPFILNRFMSRELFRHPPHLAIQEDTRHTPDLDLYSQKPVAQLADTLWNNIPDLVKGFGLEKNQRFSKTYPDGDESIQWVATETPIYYAPPIRIKNAYPDSQRPLVVEVMQGKVNDLDYVQVQWSIPLDKDHQYMQPIWTIFVSDMPEGEALATDTRTGRGINAWARTKTDVMVGLPPGRKKWSHADDIYFHTDPNHIATLKQKNECGPDFEALPPGKQAVECMRMNQLAVRWWDMPYSADDIDFIDKWNPPIGDESLSRMRRVMEQNARLYNSAPDRSTIFSQYQRHELRRRAKQSAGVENPYLAMHLLGVTQNRLAFPRLARLSDGEYFSMLEDLPSCVNTLEEESLIYPEEHYWSEYHWSVPPTYDYMRRTKFNPSFRPGFKVLGKGFNRHLHLPQHIRQMSDLERVHTVFTV